MLIRIIVTSIFFGALAALFTTGFVLATPLNFQLGAETPVDVGTLGSTQTVILDQNDAGQVVGYSYPFVSANFRNAMLWDPVNGMTNLGTPGTTHSFAFGINESGSVVGYGLRENNTAVPFLWDAINGMQTLPTLGDPFTVAVDINIHNQVVGYALDTSGKFKAFIWDATSGIQNLGTLGGAQSLALGINDRGMVSAESQNVAGEFRAAFWTANHGMVDLGVIGASFDINESGVIAGKYVSPNTENHAFTWDGLVFSTDFENGLPTEITSTDWFVETMDSGADGTYGDHGFSSTQFLRSKTTKGIKSLAINLTDLPTHSNIDLDFLLATIDKTQNGDGIEVRLDGITIFSESIAFDASAWNPAAPIEMFTGIKLGYKDNPVGYDKGLNLGRVGTSDQSLPFDFSQIPHSASTLTLEIIATTAKKGPTYAIDDLSIILDNSVHDVGTLGGTSSVGYAINEDAQVVGMSQTATGAFHAFVWDSDTESITDVNDYLDPSNGWAIERLWGINNAGDLAGVGFTGSPSRGVVLLNP